MTCDPCEARLPNRLAAFSLYQEKAASYFSHVREDLIALMDNCRDGVVLDVGCGIGLTGRQLRERGKAKVVFGVEKNPEAAQKAEAVLDQVWVGDVEETELPFSANSLDCILLGDVLEHLADLWQTLKKLSGLVKGGGAVVASIPNVRYWRIVRDLLLRGRWEYTDEGILDRTHLRFFTRRSITELFKGAGLAIEVFSYEPIRGKSRIFDVLTGGLFRDCLIRKFLIRARK